jgi:hypothetical protein
MNSKICCHICGTNNFRRSRILKSDLPYLLHLQYPVRCRHCHERIYIGLLPALTLPRPVYATRRMHAHP